MPIRESSRIAGWRSPRPTCTLDLAGRLFQDAVQQLENALLLFQGLQQFPHLLACQVQVQRDQVGSALHVDGGTEVDIEQAPGVQTAEPPQQRVVVSALQMQPALQLLANVGQHPAVEVLVDVVADRRQIRRR